MTCHDDNSLVGGGGGGASPMAYKRVDQGFYLVREGGTFSSHPLPETQTVLY